MHNYKDTLSLGTNKTIKLPNHSGPSIRHCKSHWQVVVKEVTHLVLNLRVGVATVLQI